MKPPIRRVIRWSLVVLICAGTGAAAVAWLMFQYVPTWYQPLAVGPAYHGRVRSDWAGTIDRLQEALISSETAFTQRFTQDQLNAWVANRESIWPLSREWLPKGISSPFLRFTDSGLTVAVTANYGSLKAVVSADFELAVRDDAIHVRLIDAHAGALPVPRRWLEDLLTRASTRGWPAGERISGQLDGPPIPPLPQLLNGASFPRAWIIKRRQPFRIDRIQFQQGTCDITLRALPRDQRANR